MTSLDRALEKLAAGELAEVRQLLAKVSRQPATQETFDALMVLVEAELLSNTTLEAARTLAAARRVCRELQRPQLEHLVGLRGLEASLLSHSYSIDGEVRRLREQLDDPADLAWLDSLDAVGCARQGREDEAHQLLERAQRAAVGLEGAAALRVLPWVCEAELALDRPQRALEAAQAGMWVASALGQLGHRSRLQRLVHAAEGASSPQAQQAVLGLVDLASATAGVRDLKPLLEQVGKATLELLDVDRTFVVLKSRTGPMRIAAGMGRQGTRGGQPSRSIVERTLRTGLPVVSNDLDRDGSARSASIVAMGLRSVICAPMLDGPRALGVIYGDSERVTEHELKRVAWLARGIAGVAAVAVANAQRLEASERRTREGREIAHDVRNLLSSVQLSAEDLGEADDVPVWARELAGQSRQATLRMQRHLDRLLSATPPEREVVALGPLVDELVGLLERQARQVGVRFRVDADPVQVAVEPGEMARALTNLLSNAIKYSPEGSEVRVRVNTAGEAARIVVSDAGPGIPEAELRSIFTSGVQARGAVAGHGLGLGIAARVVGEHGGEIWAENPPEGGARFVVELPLS